MLPTLVVVKWLRSQGQLLHSRWVGSTAGLFECQGHCAQPARTVTRNGHSDMLHPDPHSSACSYFSISILSAVPQVQYASPGTIIVEQAPCSSCVSSGSEVVHLIITGACVGHICRLTLLSLMMSCHLGSCVTSRRHSQVVVREQQWQWLTGQHSFSTYSVKGRGQGRESCR